MFTARVTRIARAILKSTTHAIRTNRYSIAACALATSVVVTQVPKAEVPNTNRVQIDQEVSLSEEEVKRWLAFGTELVKQGEFRKALQGFDEIIRSEPSNFLALVYKGLCLGDLYALEGNTELIQQSIDCFDKALITNPSSSSAWVAKGIAHSHAQNYGVALASFDKALKLDAASVDAWYFKGLVLSAQNDQENSVHCLSRASQLNPFDACIWRELGSAYILSGNPKKAVGAYYKALALDPSLYDVWNALGHTVALNGDFPHAVEFFRRAIDGNPHNAFSWHNHAMALFKLEQFDEATRSLSRAMELEPNNRLFIQDFKLIEKQKGRSEHVTLPRPFISTRGSVKDTMEEL